MFPHSLYYLFVFSNGVGWYYISVLLLVSMMSVRFHTGSHWQLHIWTITISRHCNCYHILLLSDSSVCQVMSGTLLGMLVSHNTPLCDVTHLLSLYSHAVRVWIHGVDALCSEMMRVRAALGLRAWCCMYGHWTAWQATFSLLPVTLVARRVLHWLAKWSHDNLSDPCYHRDGALIKRHWINDVDI